MVSAGFTFSAFPAGYVLAIDDLVNAPRATLALYSCSCLLLSHPLKVQILIISVPAFPANVWAFVDVDEKGRCVHVYSVCPVPGAVVYR